MNKTILENICYTDQVFYRFNKKLKSSLNNDEIKKMVELILTDDNSKIIRQGKNYYISNEEYKIRLTINTSNYRLITADLILN